MKTPHERFTRVIHLLVALATAFLVACGPGGGGTGTGPTASYTSATGQGGSVGVPGDPGGSTVTPGTGTCTCGRVDLRVFADHVELVSACGTFVAALDSILMAGIDYVLPGMLERAADHVSIPAFVRLRLGSGSVAAPASLTLLDSSGATLQGPAPLFPVDVLPPRGTEAPCGF